MEKYIVQEGDNIITIARKFGVRIIDIINANSSIDVTYLQPGLELNIPVPNYTDNMDERFDFHTVKKGDNLYQIAKMHNISVDDLAAINGLKKDEYLHINQKIMVPKEGVMIYITKEKDTLKNVSNKLGVSSDELVSSNEIFLLPEQMIVYKKNT